MTDNWDRANPDHQALANSIEIGSGIPDLRSVGKARKALKVVGYHVMEDEDLAARPSAIPWFQRYEAEFSKAQDPWEFFLAFIMSPIGVLITRAVLWFFELVRLVPEGTYNFYMVLREAQVALVDAGRRKVRMLHTLYSLVLAVDMKCQLQLFTPMHLFVARKPTQ